MTEEIKEERIPEFVTKLFWDVKRECVDIEKHPFFIIRRVLDYGDVKAITWLRKTYPDELIKKVVYNKRGLEHKTREFWNRYYNLEQESENI